MDNKLIVSSSPHISSKTKTQDLMRDVIIALCPALIASIIIFGFRSLLVTVVSIVTCVLAEYICRKIMKRENSISDLSAVVTGMLLAFNLPSGIPLYIVVIGGITAIVVIKQMFGGLGQNFMNPALGARVILMTSFPTLMTTWPATNFAVDTTSSATPLALIAAGTTEELPTYLEMFLGLRGGCLGETCILALIIGGVYLVIRKVISPIIPVVYIGAVFILSALLGQDPLMMIMSGGLFLGAIFMATDYVTSPLTNKGKVIYALGAAVMTVLIRSFGSLPEGVSFSIILMNVLTPLIERYTRPRAFGVVKEAKKS